MQITKHLVFLALLAFVLPAAARVTHLHDARMSTSSQKTRIVFDLSGDIDPDIFMVGQPLRLVIDLPHTKNSGHFAGPATGMIKDVRTGVHQGDGVRVVLDLADQAKVKSFMLIPSGKGDYRLVVDLYPKNGEPITRVARHDQKEADSKGRQDHTAGAAPEKGAEGQGAGNRGLAKAMVSASQSRSEEKAAEKITSQNASGESKSSRPGKKVASRNHDTDSAQKAAVQTRTVASNKAPSTAVAARPPVRDVVVAIDAGHGGRDPGATGPHGVKEKNITLAIARDLKRMIDDQPHMKGVLTRKGDYYVGLRQRMINARKAKADFFVSIHADASPGGGRAKGASVYALSNHGATSEHARWLQHRENAADMVSGTDLTGTKTRLASFVLDLSQSASIAASMNAAQRVLSQMGQIGTLHKSHVQQAAFVVLKSPDIPSILVETNFITNPVMERKLASTLFQKKVAAAILRGVKGYFSGYRPETYIAAEQKHRVRQGDTLSGIAQIYGVSVSALRRANNLKGNEIYVGNMLEIPSAQTQLVASRS